MVRRYAPAAIVAIFVIDAVAAMRWPGRPTRTFDLDAFGQLPVSMSSRVQPIDSVARMGLLQIRGTVTVPLDSVGIATRAARIIRPATGSLSATGWLLELMTKPDEADARRVFPVRDARLVSTLGLPSGRRYYAFNDIAPRLAEVGKQALRVAKVKPADRTPWERELLRLRSRIVIYERLKNSLQPNSSLQQAAKGKPVAYDFAGFLTGYVTDLKKGVEAAVAREHGGDKTLDKSTEDRMRTFARPFAMVARTGSLAPIPPDAPKSARDHWQNLGDVLIDSARTGQLPLSVGYYAAMSSAYVQGKPDLFNRQEGKYREWLLDRGFGLEVNRASSEFLNNGFQPFVRAAAVYSIALILIGFSWWSRSVVLYRSSSMLLVLALLLHTTGLVFDMMLEGRLPTTNVYSSVMAAGWLVALIGMGVERGRHRGMGILVATITALATIIGAHGLTTGGIPALFRAVVDPAFLIALLTAALVAWRASASEDQTRPGKVSPSGEAGSRVRITHRLIAPGYANPFARLPALLGARQTQRSSRRAVPALRDGQ